jgi:SagB-type dehydrogenase family enzyme
MTACHIKASLGIFITFLNIQTSIYANDEDMKIKLNTPRFKAESFQISLGKRSSCRNFQDKILILDDITSILWAACGKKHDAVTAATRIIPSAGATYPLELYVVVGKASADRLKEGVYHYDIEEHTLGLVATQDRRVELSRACLGQDFIRKAPASIVITAKFHRTTNRYETRGQRYVYIEAGHACQNIYLAAANLGLGTVEVGAFVDGSVSRVLELDKDCLPLCVMPIGYPG